MVANERYGDTFHGSDLWCGVGWFRRTPASGSSTGGPEAIEQKLSEPVATAVEPGGKYYLIGFMGSGKTSVGPCLADLLGTEFVDLDHAVEVDADMPVARIFAEQGEKRFRRLESVTLRRLAGREDGLVIAVGGGTPMRPENVELMRSTGITFWLDPSFDAILSRLNTADRQRRPLFASPAEARALYEKRRHIYSSAGLRVDIGTEEQPDEVARRIIRMSLEADPGGRSQAGER